MQNTRLSTLFDRLTNQLTEVFRNPWRRLALLVISLLLGIFLGSAIVTTAGQAAEWDIVAAAILASFTEVVSRLVYGDRGEFRRSLLAGVLNALKIGLTYSLFIEAFKIGS